MLAKPRFLRGARGTPPEPQTSRSRFNPKGLLRPFLAGCGLAETQKNPRRPDHRGPHLAGEEHFVSGVAGRYATALFELARDANAIDAAKADLERFDALVAESPDLARLVRSP